MVVRVGVPGGPLSTLANPPGTALPVFLDYVDASGGLGVRQSIALPSTARAGGTPACTLSFGSSADGSAGSTAVDWGWATEGMPSNDDAQTQLFVGCHTAAAGTSVSLSAPKTIAVARLGTSGVSVNTSALFTAYSGRRGSATGFRGVYSPDGARFWLAGTSATLSGLRYVALGAAASARVYGGAITLPTYQLGSLDLRAVGDNGAGALMYSSAFATEPAASEGGFLLYSRAGLPAASQATGTFVVVPGFGTAAQRRSFWGFTFAPRAAALYVIVDLCRYARLGGPEDAPDYARTSHGSAIAKFTPGAGGAWAQDPTATTLLTSVAVYALVGRTSFSGTFLLYTASRSQVIEVNPATKATRVLATAVDGTQFRGVALPPLRPPTPSVTPSVAPSSSRTPSSSKKAKRSRRAV